MGDHYAIVDCDGYFVNITDNPEFLLDELNNDCLDDGKPFSIGYICVPVEDWNRVEARVRMFEAAESAEGVEAAEYDLDAMFEDIATAAIAAVHKMREA